MALPPKGDPARPVALAANAARVLGVVSIVHGVLSLGGAGAIGNDHTFAAGVLVMAAGLCLVAGILYLVFAGFLKRYQVWAAIVLLVMASLHTILAALSVLNGIAQVFDDSTNLGPLVFYSFFLVVGVLLIIYLSQSLAVIRTHNMQQPRGHAFQPIIPLPSIGIMPSYEQPSDPGARAGN